MKKLLFSSVWLSLYLFSLSAQHNNETPANSEMKGVWQKLGNEYLRVALYSDQEVFWCPMDCEQGKMYNKKGTCPVCNMNLIPQQRCYIEVFLLNADQKTPFLISSNTLTAELTFIKQKTPKKVMLQSAPLNQETKEMSSHFIAMLMLPKDLSIVTLKIEASFGAKDHRKTSLDVKTEKLIQYPLDYCLITNEKIIEKEMILLIHEGYEFQLCCKGCVKDFRAEPQKYLQQIAAMSKNQNLQKPTSAPTKTENTPYPFDYCIISEEELGSMGDPIIKVYDGQEVKFCCASCIKTFEKDKKTYLKKIKDGKNHSDHDHSGHDH